MSDKWEYLTKFEHAHIDNPGARELIMERWPDWKDLAKYAPQTMMANLNGFGAKGWELVHMEPVAAVGDKGDVLFTGEFSKWSNVYFCVFKRTISSE